MRVANIDGVPIPAGWPEVRPNSKVRTTAAVEVARSLIRAKPSRCNRQFAVPPIEFPPDPQFDSLGRENSPDTPISPARSGKPSNSPISFEKSHSLIPALPRCEHHEDKQLFHEVRMRKKKTKKLPDAIEAARALVKVNAKSPATKAPIVFDRCDDDPADNVAPAKRRGHVRTQPPAHLRDEMPEHSDQAYFKAQAQLRLPCPHI